MYNTVRIIFIPILLLTTCFFMVAASSIFSAEKAKKEFSLWGGGEGAGAGSYIEK
jgi:hypothetical protein